MRSTSLLLSSVLAACTSGGSYKPPIDLVPETPDRVASLSCQASLHEACGSCNLTLDAALEDRRLCEFGPTGAVEACGAFVVVHRGELDTQTLFFYREGQLAAIVGAGIGGSLDVLHCAGGPQSFEAPHCNGEHAVPLPACATN
jgi:hypothetical protein